MGGVVALERAEVGRVLRGLGWSYGEIREVIDVPKATLAGWCRDIRLTDDQIVAMKHRGARTICHTASAVLAFGGARTRGMQRWPGSG